MFKLAVASIFVVSVLALSGCGDDDDQQTVTPSGDTGAEKSPPQVVTVDHFTPSFTLEVPSEWRPTDQDNGVFKVRRQDTPSSPPGELWFSQLSSVYDYSPDNAPLKTPPDLAAFIRDHPWLKLLAETDVEVGGLNGVRFELTSEEDEYWSLYEETIGTFNIYDGDHFAIYVLNGPEEQFVMAYAPDQPERFEAFAAEAEKLVASVEFADGATETFTSTLLPISVTVSPGAGWLSPDDVDLVDLFAVIQNEFPKGYIDFVQPTQVYNRPTETEAVLAEPPADYVQWFNDIPFGPVTAMEDVTVGGLQGTRLTISNPNNESYSLFKLSAGDYHLSYQDTDYAYVLNSGDSQILVICGTDNGRDFAEFQTACEEAVATAKFGS